MMTSRRGVKAAFVALAIVAGTLYLAAPRVLAEPANPVDPKLYAVLIFDTDSSLKPYLGGNKAILTEVFKQGFDRRMNNYWPKVFEGPNVMSVKVLAHIQGLKGKVKAIDTVFVYYGGHGATLEGKGHYFTMHNDWTAGRPGLGRKELLNELQKLKARHIVVLSDCCSETIRGVFGKEAALPKASWPVLDCLFFHHKGVTDINACQKNAFSWFYNNDKEAGGAFTLALGPLLCTKKEDFRKVFKSGDGFVTWRQFATPLQEGTNERYVKMRAEFLNIPPEKLSNQAKDTQQKARGQLKQEPEIISLAKKAPQYVRERKWLFGAELGKATKKSGKTSAIIGIVRPKTLTGEPTPAAKAGVQKGDLILAVNGIATPTDLDAAREIDHSEQKMTLTIQRGTDKPMPLVVELIPVKKPS